MLITAEEVIAKSWRDYIANWHDWAIYSLILFVPGFVLILAGSFGGYLNTYYPGTSIPTNIIILLMVVASAVMWFWSYLALTHAIGKYLRTKQTDRWKEHYSITLGLFWPALYTSVYKGVIVALGTLLFIIPGIIFSVWYLFVTFNVVLGGERGMPALKTSKGLVRGRWWGVVWRVLLPTVVFGIGIAVANFVSLLLLEALPLSEESNTLVGNILGSLFSAIFTPLTTLALLNLFFSLKDNPAAEIQPLPSNQP